MTPRGGANLLTVSNHHTCGVEVLNSCKAVTQSARRRSWSTKHTRSWREMSEVLDFQFKLLAAPCGAHRGNSAINWVFCSNYVEKRTRAHGEWTPTRRNVSPRNCHLEPRPSAENAVLILNRARRYHSLPRPGHTGRPSAISRMGEGVSDECLAAHPNPPTGLPHPVSCTKQIRYRMRWDHPRK